MTTISIGNYNVSFPYESLYPSQIEYMRKVLEALDGGSNALLESPTGTGKSLCMLCAVLAWLRARDPFDRVEPLTSLSVAGPSEGNLGPCEDKYRVLYCLRTHAQLSHIVSEFKKTSYSSEFTMAILASKEKTCNLCCGNASTHGSSSDDFIASQWRETELCRNVFGVGKFIVKELAKVRSRELPTLNLRDLEETCTLASEEKFCPYFYQREIAKFAPVVFLPYNYLFDADTLGLKSGRAESSHLLPFLLGKRTIVIVDEAHNISSSLASGIDTQFTALQLAAAIEELDQAMLLVENIMGIQDESDGYDVGDNHFPARINDDTDEDGNADKDTGIPLVVPTIVDLSDEGTSSTVDSIDPQVFLSLLSVAKLQLVQLERNICSLSFDESEKLHKGVEKACDTGALGHLTKLPAPQLMSPVEELISLGDYALELFAASGVDITEKTFCQGRFCLATVLASAARLTERHGKLFARAASGNTSKSYEVRGGLRAAIDFFSRIFSVAMCNADELKSGFRFIVYNDNSFELRSHLEGSFENRSAVGAFQGTVMRSLSFWCVDLQIPMRRLAMRVGPLLLTSGTLSPMDHFATELGIAFNVRLQGSHVIDSSRQLRSIVLRSGPRGKRLNSSFIHRADETYLSELGTAICSFAAIVPNGLIVFFPSYGAMNAAVSNWKAFSTRVSAEYLCGAQKRARSDTGLECTITATIENACIRTEDSDCGSDKSSIWAILEKYKTPYIEPRSSNQLEGVIKAYKLAALSRRGAVLLAVARGKVSEGVDFADKHARAVILTGIPFAGLNDLRVRLQRDYYDERCRNSKMMPNSADKGKSVGFLSTAGNGPSSLNREVSRNFCLSGRQWYVTEAMRAVNQCIGRVIRHKNDYGVVVLADERFSENKLALSRWVRESSGPAVQNSIANCALTRESNVKNSNDNCKIKPTTDDILLVSDTFDECYNVVCSFFSDINDLGCADLVKSECPVFSESRGAAYQNSATIAQVGLAEADNAFKAFHTALKKGNIGRSLNFTTLAHEVPPDSELSEQFSTCSAEPPLSPSSLASTTRLATLFAPRSKKSLSGLSNSLQSVHLQNTNGSSNVANGSIVSKSCLASVSGNSTTSILSSHQLHKESLKTAVAGTVTEVGCAGTSQPFLKRVKDLLAVKDSSSSFDLYAEFKDMLQSILAACQQMQKNSKVAIGGMSDVALTEHHKHDLYLLFQKIYCLFEKGCILSRAKQEKEDNKRAGGLGINTVPRNSIVGKSHKTDMPKNALTWMEDFRAFVPASAKEVFNDVVKQYSKV